jgi:hypothetical protein
MTKKQDDDKHSYKNSNTDYNNHNNYIGDDDKTVTIVNTVTKIATLTTIITTIT